LQNSDAARLLYHEQEIGPAWRNYGINGPVECADEDGVCVRTGVSPRTIQRGE
jgi:hypothetical protein